MGTEFSYGHWQTVIILSVIWFVCIGYMLRPATLRQWAIFILFMLFVAEQYAELYGYPYTLAIFEERMREYPTAHLLGNRAGDLWRIWFLLDDVDETIDVFHLVGGIFIFGGLFMLISAWFILKNALAYGKIATAGLYASIRHPQYLALIVIMLGFLIQGPTLVTLILFPLLIALLRQQARIEEEDLLESHGAEYGEYMKRYHRFLPHW